MIIKTDKFDHKDFQWKIETHQAGCSLSVIDEAGYEVLTLYAMPPGKLKQLVDLLVEALSEPAPAHGCKTFKSQKFQER
jgi:hypothetical protein